jgi:hypothetical protein
MTLEPRPTSSYLSLGILAAAVAGALLLEHRGLEPLGYAAPLVAAFLIVGFCLAVGMASYLGIRAFRRKERPLVFPILALTANGAVILWTLNLVL